MVTKTFHYLGLEIRFTIENDGLLTVNGFDLEKVYPIGNSFNEWLSEPLTQKFIDELCQRNSLLHCDLMRNRKDMGYDDLWVYHDIGAEYTKHVNGDFHKWYHDIVETLFCLENELKRNTKQNATSFSLESKSALQIFENNQFGQVRIAGTPDNPLFCLADICKAVELTNPSSVKSRLDKEDVQLIDLHALNGNIEIVGNSMATFITETGFYEVILFSNSSKVKPFRRWITKEVLPSIRKTGHYGTPHSFAEALRLAAEQQEAIERQQALLEQQRPSVEYVNATIADDYEENYWTISKLVKVLNQNGYPQKLMKFFEYLRSNGYIYKRGKENLPCQKYLDMGLFYIKEHEYDSTGKLHKSQTTLVTTKGQVYFIHKLIGANIDTTKSIIRKSAYIE